MKFLFILSETSLYPRLQVNSGRHQSYFATFRRVFKNAPVRNLLRFRPSKTKALIIPPVLRDDEIIQSFRYAVANQMINPLYSDVLRLGRMYEQFYLGIFDQYSIECIVLHNTSFAYQWIGVLLARRQGIRSLITEGGYFMPYTATIETEGVNAHSAMRRWDRNRSVNPDWFRAFRTFYDHYKQTKKRSTRTKEWWLSLRYHSIDRWIDTEGYPLRIISRTQKALWKARTFRYRDNGVLSSPRIVFFISSIYDPQHPFPASKYVEDRCRLVLKGWAQFHRDHPQYTLIVKEHPADDKLVLLPVLNEFAAASGVRFSTEDAGTLIDNCAVVLTINSGVGIEALCKYKSVICLGDALYNHEGLVLPFSADGSGETFAALLKVASTYSPDADTVDSFLGELFAKVQFITDQNDEGPDGIMHRFYDKAEALLGV